jgi:uncharacterized protein YggU (UPF0235/DUF167 family)
LARLSVRVTPRAGRDSIDAFDTSGVLRVRVAAAPADGAANEAVRRLLARRLGIAPSRVTIVAGASSRTKTVEIAGLDSAAVRAALAGEP